MRCLHLVSIGCLALALAACETIPVESPIGTDPVQLDPNEWEGTWVMFGPDGGAFYVDAADAEKGVLEVRWINYHEDPDVVEKWTAYLRNVGGRIIFSATNEGDGTPPYDWGLLIMNGAHANIFSPDIGRVKALIEQGKLPGTIGDDGATLGHMEPEHLDLLASDREGFLFGTHDPLMATRVAWSSSYKPPTSDPDSSR